MIIILGTENNHTEYYIDLYKLSQACRVNTPTAYITLWQILLVDFGSKKKLNNETRH